MLQHLWLSSLQDMAVIEAFSASCRWSLRRRATYLLFLGFPPSFFTVTCRLCLASCAPACYAAVELLPGSGGGVRSRLIALDSTVNHANGSLTLCADMFWYEAHADVFDFVMATGCKRALPSASWGPGLDHHLNLRAEARGLRPLQPARRGRTPLHPHASDWRRPRPAMLPPSHSHSLFHGTHASQSGARLQSLGPPEGFSRHCPRLFRHSSHASIVDHSCQRRENPSLLFASFLPARCATSCKEPSRCCLRNTIVGKQFIYRSPLSSNFLHPLRHGLRVPNLETDGTPRCGFDDHFQQGMQPRGRWPALMGPLV